MRVLYVGRGHVGHDARFADAWRASGAEVTVIEAAGLADEELAAAIAAAAPDVVQTGPVTEPGARVARLWGGPLIATSWSFDVLHDVEADAAARADAIATLRRADLILVDNDGPQRAAIALGAPADRIVQFPWGVDARWFTPDPRPLRPAGQTVFFSTRRHEPIYRVGDVVEAFLRVAPAHAGIRLRLAGGGSLHADLRALAEGAEGGGRIEFLGEVAHGDLPALYATADVYVSTSSVDGSSVSLLEAMAGARPVVVSRIEGNAQWVTGQTGFDYELGDVAGLAALLDGFATEGSTVREAAPARVAAATALVRERADWGATVRTFPRLAERAIDGARKRGAA
jgi:glycosyltransferase involved in cell wall biosynthesis